MKFQVTTQGSAILGKEAYVKLGLLARVGEINTDMQGQSSQKMANTYSDVFKGLGLIKSNAKIHIDEEMPPAYLKKKNTT